VLPAGAPGTGTTLPAKAVAREAGAPFFAMSASEFVEMIGGGRRTEPYALWDHGIMPHSNNLLAIGGATRLMNSARI
jgi:hypothetical protein